MYFLFIFFIFPIILETLIETLMAMHVPKIMTLNTKKKKNLIAHAKYV